jgi:hypothetical protein
MMHGVLWESNRKLQRLLSLFHHSPLRMNVWTLRFTRSERLVTLRAAAGGWPTLDAFLSARHPQQGIAHKSQSPDREQGAPPAAGRLSPAKSLRLQSVSGAQAPDEGTRRSGQRVSYPIVPPTANFFTDSAGWAFLSVGMKSSMK